MQNGLLQEGAVWSSLPRNYQAVETWNLFMAMESVRFVWRFRCLSLGMHSQMPTCFPPWVCYGMGVAESHNMSDVQGLVRNELNEGGYYERHRHGTCQRWRLYMVISLLLRSVQQVCLKERLSPILHWNILGPLPPRVCHGMADEEKHDLSDVQIFLRMIWYPRTNMKGTSMRQRWRSNPVCFVMCKVVFFTSKFHRNHFRW